MAVRVTQAEVEAIIEIESSIDLTPFIAAANIIVTNVVTDSAIDADHLKEIERWLSAHCVSMGRDMRVAKEKADDASVEYQGKTKMHLEATLYGQMAMDLDTSGALTEWNNEIEDGLQDATMYNLDFDPA